MKHVFALLGFVLLCGLGIWQLERREWKENLLSHIAMQLAQEPVNLNADLPGNLDYRRVSVTGQFMPLGELLMGPRVQNGQAGWHVLGYFRDVKGRTWLVNRGWVPYEFPKSREYNERAVDGTEVVLTGIARKPPVPGRFVPANDLGRGNWFYYEPEKMFRAVELTSPPLHEQFLRSAVTEWVIEAESAPWQDLGLPVGGITKVNLPNNHLQYALTWFSLAGALLAVYLASCGKTRRRAH